MKFSIAALALMALPAAATVLTPDVSTNANACDASIDHIL